MKKFLTGVAITLTFALSILCIGSATAQTNKSGKYPVNLTKPDTNDIRVDVNVKFNDISAETSQVEVKLYNHNSGISHKITINDNFALFLRYDTEYTITFSHKGFFSRAIHINTECPHNEEWEIDLTMRLYNDRDSYNAGNIFYDKHEKTFIALANK